MTGVCAACAAGVQAASKLAYVWNDKEPRMPGATEVLFYAFLVARLDSSSVDVGTWAKQVLAERARQEKPATECILPDLADWQPRGTQPAEIFKPLRIAFNSTSWGHDELDKIGAAIKGWCGDGKHDGCDRSDR